MKKSNQAHKDEEIYNPHSFPDIRDAGRDDL
jgi:hypothetical protein